MTTVSILVAIRNERDQIAACLESILAGDYPPDRLEVLVVDGMSTDGTREVVRELARRHPSVRLLDNARRIAAAAFNIGVRESSGEIVLIMSAHARYSADYVSACVRHLEESGADDVGGSMITIPEGRGLAARSIAAVLSHPFGVGNARFRLRASGPIWSDTVFGGCYRKPVFSKVGSFDERLIRGWDMDFNNRLRRSGGRILLVPSIKVWYVPKGGLSGFLRQNLRDGFWALRTIAVSGRSFRVRHFVPAGFVTALGLLAALSAVWRPALWPLAAIGSTYFLAAVVSGIQLALRERDALLALAAPPLFALRHASYGFGSVVGLLRSVLPSRRSREPEPRGQTVAQTRRLADAARYEQRSRRIDVCVGSCALVVFAPLLAVIAAALAISSGFPVVYRGPRVGRRGRLFRMLKFRTMVRNADALGTSVTRDGDSRVTLLGRLLRRWKLDELPQLWNVVRGDMALVGPRPDAPEIVATYTEPLRRALDVRPGLTSLASLRLRNEAELLRGTRFPDRAYQRVLVPAKVDLALEHVRRRSIAFDWRVVAATAGAWLGLRRPDLAEREFLTDLRRRIEDFDRREAEKAAPAPDFASGRQHPGSRR